MKFWSKIGILRIHYYTTYNKNCCYTKRSKSPNKKVGQGYLRMMPRRNCGWIKKSENEQWALNNYNSCATSAWYTGHKNNFITKWNFIQS